jgi:glycine/D-amino acid oxidase-like deaminating enzyme
MRVTIVGAGIMGLATAWALARAGHRVTVFEQGPIPNPLGSSVDEHRLIRHPYGRAAGYTRMVDEAFAGWDQLWADLGERLYVPTGFLAIAGEGDRWARDSAETMAAQGRTVRWLTPGELERNFPFLDVAGISEAFLATNGGVLLAGRIVVRLAEHLRARGCILEAETRVAAVDPVRARVVLATGAVIEADAVVVAAGAWVDRLVPRLAQRVTPSRQVVAYVAPPASSAALWTIAPAIAELGGATGFYAVPPVAGTRLKIGDHRFSLSGDPDDDRKARPGEADGALAAAGRRIRDFERYRIVEARACYYSVEPDEEFVVERLSPSTWVVSACSGHGFKFGAVLGLRLAAAVLDAGRAGDISLWAAGKAA